MADQNKKTNQTKELKINFKKLVRDKIPEILEDTLASKKGLMDYQIEKLEESDKKITIRLKKKLLEEIKEVKKSLNKNNQHVILNEIADVYEVLSVLMSKFLIDYETLSKTGDFQQTYEKRLFHIDESGYTNLMTDDKFEEGKEQKVALPHQYKTYIINYLRFLAKNLLHCAKFNTNKATIIKIKTVFFLFLKELKIDFAVLMSHREAKNRKMGSFTKNFVLQYITINENHPKYNFYLKQQEFSNEKQKRNLNDSDKKI